MSPAHGARWRTLAWMLPPESRARPPPLPPPRTPLVRSHVTSQLMHRGLYASLYYPVTFDGPALGISCLPILLLLAVLRVAHCMCFNVYFLRVLSHIKDLYLEERQRVILCLGGYSRRFRISNL
jgi:hypothetical protein